MITAHALPNLTALEELFLALGDKTRLRLLALMSGEPKSVGYLVAALGDSQPKISRHLAYMRQAGIVSTRRDGKWIYYGIERPIDRAARTILDCVVNSLTDGDKPGYERFNQEAMQNEEIAGERLSPSGRGEDELEIFML